MAEIFVRVTVRIRASSVKTPVKLIAVDGPIHKRVHAMNQTVFGAQLVDELRRPRTPRLPRHAERLPAHFSKKTREAPEIRRCRLERGGTLKENHAGLQGVRNFPRLLPCVPDLVCILK